MNKQLVLLFFLFAITSSLMFVTLAYSSVEKLSVPDFTLKFEDNSYDVPTTYETDQYTGKTVIKRRGYTVEDKEVIVTVKNQKFKASYNPDYTHFTLIYSVRYRGQFTEEWTYPDFIFPPNRFELSSVLNSGYTKFSIPAEDYPSGAQVDFQLRTVIGHRWTEWEIDAVSDWSETQTLTIGTESITDHPDQTTLILVGALILIPIAIGLWLLIRIGRKNRS